MAKVTEIAPCQRCKKMLKKENLLRVKDPFYHRQLCKECYIRYHRLQWGYW